MHLGVLHSSASLAIIVRALRERAPCDLQISILRFLTELKSEKSLLLAATYHHIRYISYFSQIKMTKKNISLLFLAFFGIIAIASASTSGLRGAAAAAAAGDLVEEDYDPEDFQGKEFVLIEDYNLEDMVDEEDRTLYVQPQNTQHYRFNGNHGGNNNWYNNRKYNNNRYNGNNNNNNLSGNNQFNNNRYNYNNIPNRRRDNDDDFDFCNFAYGCYGDGGLQNYYYGGGYGRGYHGRKKGYGGGYW